jgi:hypothetical protein
MGLKSVELAVTANDMDLHWYSHSHLNSILTDKGLGIYSAADPRTPFASYNHGNKVLIAFRALPGDTDGGSMHNQAGRIGLDKFDSVLSGGTYVIRRSCQALPCFLVHFDVQY